MKKILNGLLALVMTLSMFTGINANAAVPAGKITVNGTVAGKTYEIYRIFDLTYQESGENKKVSYTINSDWNNFFTGSIYISDTNTGNTLSPIVVGDSVKYINITQDKMTAFANAAQAYIKNLTAVARITATDTSVEFNNLPLGYYLVFPVNASGIANGYSTMVSIDSTLSDATVNMKAIYPSIEKEVNDNNVEVGQVQTYTISGIVPDTTGCNEYTYEISDTMTDGLTFNNDVKVYIGGKETTITATNDENGFKVSIPVMKYTIGDEIKVVYTATVNKAAINVISENKAQLRFGRNPQTTEEVKVQSTSTSVEVVKVDGNNPETKLSGAKFVLKRTVNGTTQYYAAKDSSGNLITTSENNKVSSTKTDALAGVEWVTNKDDATVLTTDTNGKANFAGIEKADNYKLEEIEAPDGYNRLVEDITVTFDENKAAQEAAQKVVENTTGATLPSTGSTLTKVFLTVGLTLAIGAYVVFITNKRMENYE